MNMESLKLSAEDSFQLGAYDINLTADQVRSTRLILKAFQEGQSRSVLGKVESGKNRLMVQLFLAENKNMMRLSRLRADINEGRGSPLKVVTQKEQSRERSHDSADDEPQSRIMKQLGRIQS